MPLPVDFRYSKEHTWIEKVNEQEAVIGITDFAQSELGEIVYVDLPAIGTSFSKDQVFGSVEALKTTSDLFMPVSGEVIALNEGLANEPTLVNTAPFTEGWLMKIKLLQLQEFETALTADEYSKITA
jgi:glycine cleavage system H protein